jgi:hypothetical protein
LSNKRFGFTNKICVYGDEQKGPVLDAIELHEVSHLPFLAAYPIVTNPLS